MGPPLHKQYTVMVFLGMEKITYLTDIAHPFENYLQVHPETVNIVIRNDRQCIYASLLVIQHSARL